MQITKVGFDPDDNAKVIYMQKRLDGKMDPKINVYKTYALSLGKDIHNQISFFFNKMQKLSNDGWIATDLCLDGGDFKLIWHPVEANERVSEKDLRLKKQVRKANCYA